MNRNQKISLTEQDLQFIVEESVKQYLNEGFWNNLKGAFKPMGQTAGQLNAGQAISNKFNSAKQGIQNAANRFGNGVQNAYNSASNTVSSGANTMKAGWQNAKLQGLKNDAVKALNKYLQYAENTVGGGETAQIIQNCIQALNKNANLGNARTAQFRNQFQRNLGMRNPN